MRALRFAPLLALTVTVAVMAATPRVFLVDLGVAGVALEVNGRPVGATDASGTLRLELEVEVGTLLAFRSADPAWILEAVEPVPPPDPHADVQYWDLSAELHPRPPAPPAPPPPAPPPPAPLPPPPPPAPPERDPCDHPSSLLCRLARWERFEAAVGRRDCDAALAAADQLTRAYPELLGARETVAAIAEVEVECAASLADAGRRAIQLGHALELATGFGDGAFWCQAEESRLLARAFEALGEPAAAAASAARAGAGCPPESTPAREWEVYFRLQGGDVDRARELAAATPGRLGTFLRAWLELERGECGTAVELEPSGDLPCVGLPQDFCARQYGRILLACGHSRDDFAAAARYLRSSLPLEPAAWEAAVAGEGREVVALLAEAELAGRRYDEAARLFADLLKTAPSDTEGATLQRLYGDARLLAAAGEEGWRAALGAYELALRRLPSGSVDAALVLNNVLTLRVRLGEAPDPAAMAADLATLETAIEALPESEKLLRLGLRRNVLALRIELVARDPSLDDAERLARLAALRAPFAAYQSELGAWSAAAGGDPEGVRAGAAETIEVAGRRFVLALP